MSAVCPECGDPLREDRTCNWDHVVRRELPAVTAPVAITPAERAVVEAAIAWHRGEERWDTPGTQYSAAIHEEDQQSRAALIAAVGALRKERGEA